MSGRTVLVVDDAAAIRLLCRVNLELDGHRVLEAGTLAEARQHLESSPVDLVILDVHVGNEDGLAFLDELRRVHTGLPVVMLTGTTSPEALRPRGADAVLTKPFELEELQRAVRTLGRAGRQPV